MGARKLSGGSQIKWGFTKWGFAKRGFAKWGFAKWGLKHLLRSKNYLTGQMIKMKEIFTIIKHDKNAKFGVHLKACFLFAAGFQTFGFPQNSYFAKTRPLLLGKDTLESRLSPSSS